MRIKLNRHGIFDQTWVWTNKELNLVKEVLKNMNTPVLHVCSGSASVGDVRLDRVLVDYKTINSGGHKQDRGQANVLGNMLELPFKDSSFPTILCDPPYDYKWFENGIYQEMVNEIVRVAKVNANILFYAPSVFTHPTLKLINTKYTQMGKRCYFKILSNSIKINGQIGDYF